MVVVALGAPGTPVVCCATTLEASNSNREQALSNVAATERLKSFGDGVRITGLHSGIVLMASLGERLYQGINRQQSRQADTKSSFRTCARRLKLGVRLQHHPFTNAHLAALKTANLT